MGNGDFLHFLFLISDPSQVQKSATLREDALSNWLLCEKKTALCIGLSAILLFDPDQVVCIQFHFEKTQFRVAGGACSGV